MTEIARKAMPGDGIFETKLIGGFEIKDAAKGEVVAVVSTMNVVDREGDVVLAGAIKDGSVVKLSAYEHDVITEGKAPVGRGVVNIVGDQAVLTAKYFMSTERGRDAFNTVAEMGPDSEWSIGFAKAVKTAPMTAEWKTKGASRLIAGLDLLESSPVFMGANGMTGTLAAKAVSETTETPAEASVEAPAEAVAEPVVESKSQMVRDLVAELKAARENCAKLQLEYDNQVAKEIFDRFRKNFKS